ncbi:hypothetical protein QOZ80_9AG0690510 [Eleusine coracana subsp. coracana]|nr:hypothetical protein QOZ80_9AG0690510 [Eleusine coracana subsp. coracana]
MGTSSGANFHQQQPQGMPPPRNNGRAPAALQTSLSLAASSEQVGSPPDTQEPLSNSDQGQDSATESASSQGTWPEEPTKSGGAGPVIAAAPITAVRMVDKEKEVVGNGVSEFHAMRSRIPSVGRVTLREVARDRVDLVADRMKVMSEELLEEIKTELRSILEGTGGAHHVEEFLYLQKLVQGRVDLTPAMLSMAHHVQLEILVAIKTGIQAFLHPSVNIPQSRLAEIGTAHTIKNGVGHAEMLFRCQACQRTSELLGWVRDVFQQCAPGWDRNALIRELDYVCKIFRLSEDSKGRNLFRKCVELVERLRSASAESMSPRMLLQALQELDMDAPKNFDNDEPGRLITPQEACNRIAEVVQEAVRKMEIVAEEKMRLYKHARRTVEACDRELEEKVRAVQELKAERLRQKQQVEELESIVRLKQAEAEMFQLKASEARQEAERLRSIALAKSAEKAGQDYASLYLKRRLEEAEAEKQYIFEKIKLQENQRPAVPTPSAAAAASSSGLGAGVGSGDPSQMMMLSKIEDLLKNVRSMPSSKSQQSK